jgi:hypothetical protein
LTSRPTRTAGLRESTMAHPSCFPHKRSPRAGPHGRIRGVTEKPTPCARPATGHLGFTVGGDAWHSGRVHRNGIHSVTQFSLMSVPQLVRLQAFQPPAPTLPRAVPPEQGLPARAHTSPLTASRPRALRACSLMNDPAWPQALEKAERRVEQILARARRTPVDPYPSTTRPEIRPTTRALKRAARQVDVESTTLWPRDPAVRGRCFGSGLDSSAVRLFQFDTFCRVGGDRGFLAGRGPFRAMARHFP